jgi:hypothetical protein
MKHLKNSLQQIAVYALTSISLSGLTPPCFAATGYVIRQANKFSGGQTISVADGAVKLSESNTGITYLCQQPHWLWQVFNEHTHKYYECAPEAFKGTAGERMVIFLHERLLKKSFKKISSGKVMNEPVEIFRSFLSSGTTDKGNRIIDQRYFEVSILAHDSLPVAVREAIGRVHGIPLGGIPMGSVYTDMLGAKRDALLTIKLEKTNINSGSFVGPKNCQKVKSEKEVFADPERDSDITEVFGAP